MKIQEFLSDDDLYELALLLNEVIWQALMAQSIPKGVKEGVVRQSDRRIGSRPIGAVVRPAMIPKRPKPLNQERTNVSPAQRLATNPKVDPIKGFNARLDNTNVWPVITDNEAEIEGKRK